MCRYGPRAGPPPHPWEPMQGIDKQGQGRAQHSLGSGAQCPCVHHGGQQLPDIQITHSHHNRGQHAPPNSTNISPPFRAFLSQGALVWQSTRRPHQLSVQHLAPRPWPCSSRRRGDVLARLRRVVVHVPTGSVLANIGRLGNAAIRIAAAGKERVVCCERVGWDGKRRTLTADKPLSGSQTPLSGSQHRRGRGGRASGSSTHGRVCGDQQTLRGRAEDHRPERGAVKITGLQRVALEIRAPK